MFQNYTPYPLDHTVLAYFKWQKNQIIHYIIDFLGLPSQPEALFSKEIYNDIFDFLYNKQQALRNMKFQMVLVGMFQATTHDPTKTETLRKSKYMFWQYLGVLVKFLKMYFNVRNTYFFWHIFFLVTQYYIAQSSMTNIWKVETCAAVVETSESIVFTSYNLAGSILFLTNCSLRCLGEANSSG